MENWREGAGAYCYEMYIIWIDECLVIVGTYTNDNVCVCVREKERERKRGPLGRLVNIFFNFFERLR